jgi:hypothetical protein
MATNQEGRHQAVRDITGTSGSYNEDFLALFAASGFSTGTFNERFLLWLNAILGETHTSLPAAMQAYAASLGFTNWSSLNTIVAGAVITLDDTTIPEDADVGDLVGTLAVVNGSGSYTFTLTDDAGGVFDVDGDALEVAAALDYETTPTYSITVEADNGVDDPVERTFTIFVTDVEEAPFTLDAPVLTWDEEADDETPDFTVDFDEDTAEDDVIRLQIDNDIAFGSPIEITNTLDAAEILAGEITMASGTLADGTYYVRARVEQPLNTPISDWSNVEEIAIVGGGGLVVPTMQFDDAANSQLLAVLDDF